MAYAYYSVIQEFGWRRIALIVQDENLFTVVSTTYVPVVILSISIYDS